MNTTLRMFILASVTVITSSYSASTTPSKTNALAFPVSGKKSNIGSYWGDERDGGRRKHEGIDIFANKGTPVVAISDGKIIAVDNSGIGGKTVYLQPDDRSWYAYYAHLDQQHVVYGQTVKKGQIIGTVGNTGNAATTPPHLHFGIYTDNGAVDPLPYVKNAEVVTNPLPAEKATPTVVKSSSKKTSTKTSRRTARKSNPNRDRILNGAVNIILGQVRNKVRL